MSSSLWSCGFQIRISGGPDKGRTFPLDATEITIGRARTKGDRAPGWILLNDPKISRIHADMLWSEEKKTYQISHKSDTNQTLLNGKPIPIDVKVDLKAGDLIRLGDSEIDLQQADFRFGGVDPMQAAAMTAHSRMTRGGQLPPALTAYDSKLDNERSMSTKKASRKAALTVRPPYQLSVVSGPGKGTVHPISGLRLALGGPHIVEDAPAPKFKNWDQEILMGDEGVPEYYISLSWRELENGFELARYPNQTSLNVHLERNADGVMWTAQLGEGESATLRDGDYFTVGRVRLCLHVPEEDE